MLISEKLKRFKPSPELQMHYLAILQQMPPEMQAQYLNPAVFGRGIPNGSHQASMSGDPGSSSLNAPAGHMGHPPYPMPPMTTEAGHGPNKSVGEKSGEPGINSGPRFPTTVGVPPGGYPSNWPQAGPPQQFLMNPGGAYTQPPPPIPSIQQQQQWHGDTSGGSSGPTSVQQQQWHGNTSRGSGAAPPPLLSLSVQRAGDTSVDTQDDGWEEEDNPGHVRPGPEQHPHEALPPRGQRHGGG